MKSGLTLQQFAATIHEQNRQKADYLVDTRNLKLESFGSDVYMHVHDNDTDIMEPLAINKLAHRQLGTHLNIPSAYYERMLTTHPELLTHNVNTWLHREPSKRMVRTLGGTARAFLSSRYRRIDNMDIAQIVLPIIGEMQDAIVESCEITETRMYLKVVNPRLEAEVVPGDIVQSGVIISNSEVGMGSVCIQPLIYRLVCSNGMIINDAQTRRNHVGRSADTDESFLMYSEETLMAEDKAFALKIQDTVKAAVEEARFLQVIDKMRTARELSMNTVDVPGVVQMTSKEFSITNDESTGVLQHLIEGKDLSLYGLSNAVTRYSQDVKSYDRSTELESIGYKILSMPQKQWNRINQMAA